MKPNLSDPVIAEIREVRHRISSRFDHDPAQLVAFYMDTIRLAELHWYEAHGIGRKEFKLKLPFLG